MIQVPAHYDPSVRPYQLDVLNGLRHSRFSVLVIHRRAGKTMATFAYAIQRMTEEPMTVVMVYPTLKQGFDNFWTNVENDGFKTIDHIPKELISRSSGTEDSMYVELKNGSVFRIIGATKPDALRGANAKIYIFDEFVDIPAKALRVVRPITLANGGQIIIQSTPKITGVSGMTFKKLYDSATKDKTQYAIYLPADKSKIFTKSQLEQFRADDIAETGNDFNYRQEMLLDWGQTDQTSYYGISLMAMEKDGRIGDHEYSPKEHVYTAIDLGGGADSTAITWFQYIDKKLNIIDYYETNNIGDEPMVKLIQSKPYIYGWHFLPHDGTRNDSDHIQRLQKWRDYGLPNSSTLPKTGVEQGIKEVVDLLNLDTTTFHLPFTSHLIHQLKIYKRKFNDATGNYEGPEHGTSSHASDSFRYVGQALRWGFDENGKCIYNSSATMERYQGEDMISTINSKNYDSYDKPYNDGYDF